MQGENERRFTKPSMISKHLYLFYMQFSICRTYKITVWVKSVYFLTNQLHLFLVVFIFYSSSYKYIYIYKVKIFFFQKILFAD